MGQEFSPQVGCDGKKDAQSCSTMEGFGPNATDDCPRSVGHSRSTNVTVPLGPAGHQIVAPSEPRAFYGARVGCKGPPKIIPEGRRADRKMDWHPSIFNWFN